MSQLSRIFERINAEEVVELTRSLVRIPSVYRPGEPSANEAEAAAFVNRAAHHQGHTPENGPFKIEPPRAALMRGTASRVQ